MARLSSAEIDKVMVAFGKSMVRRARGNLTRSRRIASKNLYRSIAFHWEKGKMHFVMECYGPLQDQGVTGHGKNTYTPKKRRRKAKSLASPPFKFTKGPVGPDADKSFRRWIGLRNIVMRDDKGRILKRSTASFLLRRSVGRFGIEPSEFFTEAWDKLYPELEVRLGKAASDAIDAELDEIFSRNFQGCKK